MRLEEQGVFEKHGVRVLETPVQAIINTGDRVYSLPVNPEFVTKSVERERPDGRVRRFGSSPVPSAAA